MAEPIYTQRGFRVYCEFHDDYDGSVRVVESSRAVGDFVWVFTGGNEGKQVEKNDGSAHLSYEQAVTLRDALTEWIEDHPQEH